MSASLAIASGVIRELVRKKDFYVLFMFLLVLLALLASQSFFHLEGVTRYIKDLGYSLVMLFSFVISVTFSAKQIPNELEYKTVYPLLAKPVSRFGVVAGKYLGGAAISLISFCLFFGVYAVFSMASGKGTGFILLAEALICGAFFMCLSSALAVFFSTFLTVSANVTLSFLIYFTMTSFSGVLRDAVLTSRGAGAWALGSFYYLMPHFDFFDLRVRLTHEWDPLATWVVCAIAAYTLIYSSFLLYFAGRIFGRKDL